jgi:hypothetical protein
MRWRSGLIASVIIGNTCLRSGSRDPDLQDRMTHTLLTISPRVEPYWCAPRPPPRAIAQRFSALAPFGHAGMSAVGCYPDTDCEDRHRRQPLARALVVTRRWCGGPNPYRHGVHPPAPRLTLILVRTSPINECRAIASVRTSVSKDDSKQLATLRAFERLHHVPSGDRRDSFYDPLDIASVHLASETMAAVTFPLQRPPWRRSAA